MAIVRDVSQSELQSQVALLFNVCLLSAYSGWHHLALLFAVGSPTRCKWGLCWLRHGIQNSMEAILACHPALSRDWLDWVAKSCELWQICTGPILSMLLLGSIWLHRFCVVLVLREECKHTVILQIFGVDFRFFFFFLLVVKGFIDIKKTSRWEKIHGVIAAASSNTEI